jgi:hypothetical protein
MGLFHTLILEHPKSVNENYCTHFIQAFSFGTKLICYGIAEYIHAIIPGIDLFHIFNTDSTIEIERLLSDLKNRKKNI